MIRETLETKVVNMELKSDDRWDVKPKCIHGSAVCLRKVRYCSSLKLLKEKITGAMGMKVGKDTREWEVICAIDKLIGDSCVEARLKH